MSVSLAAVVESLEFAGLVLILVAIIRKTPEQKDKPTPLQAAAVAILGISLLLKFGLEWHFIIPSE